ncbi:MAG TPA: polysaccharide deacetylase family protein [Solirubrobacterales bacterium]|nr:polysaccharide deacetylase family protein [Solirubrobacterales bacterium]
MRAAGNGSCIILYYHRIATPAGDPWKTSVPPAVFDAQLEFLAARTEVLPLQELVGAARLGRLPDRAVAITFDDGYFDNLDLALPILERRGQPATFYVATGLIDSTDPPWWDEIADLMLGDDTRPAFLEIKIGHEWIRAPTRTVEERESVLYGELNTLLKQLPGERVDAALRPLRRWAGRELAEATLSRDPQTESRMMTVPELERLAASDLAEIGAHTSLHPSLPALDAAGRRREIETSRDFLAELTGAAPRSFAYPFGDNDRAVRRATREAGFDHAVTAESKRPFTTADDEFAIPRIVAHDESPDELERRIESAFALIAS